MFLFFIQFHCQHFRVFSRACHGPKVRTPGWADLKIVMGRAESFEKIDGPGRAGPRVLKNWCAGLGRAESFENLMGRAGLRPIV